MEGQTIDRIDWIVETAKQEEPLSLLSVVLINTGPKAIKIRGSCKSFTGVPSLAIQPFC